MKPIIGITTFNEVRPKKIYSLVSNNYITSVQKAGGIPVLIPIGEDIENIKAYSNIVDGIIFTGGADVSPLSYDENPLRQVEYISEERDSFELKLFDEVYKKQIPILGICRGIQLINVALGGSLYQDINSQIPDSYGHLPKYTEVYNLYHSVEIEENSRLSNIFKTKELKVNSFHHQAVKKIGRNLKATAFSKDGIIEAIESINDKFLVAVQWHPEDLTVRHDEFIKLFETFINIAVKFRGNTL